MKQRYGVEVGLHMHPDIVWACVDESRKGSKGEQRSTLHCLADGENISSFVTDHPDALMPEGLAPTFRSGPRVPTEDLAFYWCHDPNYNYTQTPTGGAENQAQEPADDVGGACEDHGQPRRRRGGGPRSRPQHPRGGARRRPLLRRAARGPDARAPPGRGHICPGCGV